MIKKSISPNRKIPKTSCLTHRALHFVYHTANIPHPTSYFVCRTSYLVLRTFFCLLPTAYCLLPTPAPAQTYTLLKTITQKTQAFTTDALQNVYIITPENTLIKYDTDGNEVFRYAAKTNGKLETIDASNPFNILLYYPDFQTLVTLDRTLTETGTYNLYDLQIAQPTAVALSDVNEIWIYDNAPFQLRKFVKETNFWKQTSHFSVQFPNSKPNGMIAKDGSVYLNVPTYGIYVFDNYGHLDKTLSIKNITDFQWFDNQIIYRQNGEYFRYLIKSSATVPLHLPESAKPTEHVRVEKGRLFIQKPEGIEIYSAK